MMLHTITNVLTIQELFYNLEKSEFVELFPENALPMRFFPALKKFLPENYDTVTVVTV